MGNADSGARRDDARQGTGLASRLHRTVDVLSGENLLVNRPNSGSIIFMRSLIVSALLLTLALLVKNLADPDSSWKPSWYQIRAEIRDHVGWFGAILAAAYAGFYARYAGQWSYLASLYNQIMATGSTLTRDQRSGETFLNWQAAFLEDSYRLHLDRKDVFHVLVKQLLDDDKVRKAFKEAVTEDVFDKMMSRHLPGGPSRKVPGEGATAC